MYYSKTKNQLFSTNAELVEASLSQDDVITVSTKQPENFDRKYHELDRATGTYNKESNIFIYGKKPRKDWVIFDASGKFKKKGWAPDAVSVEYPLFDFIDENYHFEVEIVNPPSLDYLNEQVRISILKHSESLRAKLMQLTKSGELQRQWWLGKEVRAKAFINNTINAVDLKVIENEAIDRGKSESTGQLVNKQLAKANLYNSAGINIESMQSKATRLALAEGDLGEKMKIFVSERIRADNVFSEIKRQFTGGVIIKTNAN